MNDPKAAAPQQQQQRWWHFFKRKSAAPPDPNDPVAQQELLRRSHLRCVLPSYIVLLLLLLLLLGETARCIYSSILQQWVEEAVLHLNKETGAYLEYQHALFSVFSSKPASFCYGDLVRAAQQQQQQQQQQEEEFGSSERAALMEAVKAFAPSLCIYRKDLYFFEEPSGELLGNSFSEITKVVYSCGRELAALLARVSRHLPPRVFNYTQRKVQFIDKVFGLIETNKTSKNHWCAAALDDQEVQLIHNTTVELEALNNTIKKQRILGRLKLICGIQSILVASEAPPALMQMMRMMEASIHQALQQSHTAALHVGLELQSCVDTKEIIPIRTLLDGCLEVYRHELRARGQPPLAAAAAAAAAVEVAY
ncbi:Calcium/calmodulin-dependent 3',5'-cyclic nucleotide phosphodiesterase, related [Eimeria tenella]|uniref:Calcium/calmodulin-dependent 3',5'-cyclic nucleotide phosphodiesterase, related n=1 Tax=Eimeria tenella TaxID=5802 RepID=U6KL81_EIMTE|nr:Calcium/calmodulin-dependent 3',5'-cyclic nucleotide phosphodiesterase, related [Eimeria tenella]CDJ37017.1 Calcium/calmodulin-dependent 3',5'-cyclic nucleotide phosphodiesterase, related [Eimeria tenella]|eukprot:XP_013227855.1 Calcium/calmodulin-dependent 3',5'-cyclic nucleotide phosphodiesterase, related [Eimeria tenella]